MAKNPKTVKCGVCGAPGANPCVACARKTKKLIDDLKKPGPKNPKKPGPKNPKK